MFTSLFKKKAFLFILLFLLFVGLFFRFYNLNWGAPFYFHPDERNIASSVSQFSFPHNLNPHFFAYGSFPLYVIYFTGITQNTFSLFITKAPITSVFHVSFEQAILLSRIYSAVFSLLLIFFIFKAAKLLKDRTAGLIAATLGLLSVGFIQFAHFGTFEMWLTFFSFLLFYLLTVWMKKKKMRFIILAGIVLGLLLAIKVSSIVLIPLVLFTILGQSLKKKNSYLFFSKTFLLSTIIACSIYLFFSPYVFLDWVSFKNSMQYESSVALGTTLVFYTQTFFDKVPVVYQFNAIYPFLINPFVTLLFIPCFLYFIYKSITLRSPSYILLTTCYILLFLSQAFLFAKWTRYIVPTLPFMYCIIGISLSDLFHFVKSKKSRVAYIFFLTILFLVSFMSAFSFFYTVYLQEDTRVTAVRWAEKRIPKNTPILSEVYDLGITPFNPVFSNITLYDFYDLSKEKMKISLVENIQDYDVIILPSQRIFKSRLHMPTRFPNGHLFYKNLLNEKVGFTKIYQTPCDIFCTISYMGNPLTLEDTTTVFDRPTVIIFQRQ